MEEWEELPGMIGGRPLKRFPLMLAVNCLLSSGSSGGGSSGSAIWTAGNGATLVGMDITGLLFQSESEEPDPWEVASLIH